MPSREAVRRVRMPAPCSLPVVPERARPHGCGHRASVDLGAFFRARRVATPVRSGHSFVLKVSVLRSAISRWRTTRRGSVRVPVRRAFSVARERAMLSPRDKSCQASAQPRLRERVRVTRRCSPETETVRWENLNDSLRLETATNDVSLEAFTSPSVVN